SLASMQEFFAKSTALTEEEEAAIIAEMKQKHEEKKQLVENYAARIRNILETASAEKRALTRREQEEINRIQREMVDTGIQVLSEHELEAKAIMERMKAHAGDISAQQAAEVVQNSIAQRDGAIKAAEEQYNSVLKEIIKQRDEL